MLSILAFIIVIVSVVRADDIYIPEAGRGGFVNDCTGISLVKENHHVGLRAQCRAPGNKTQCTILDLNSCFSYDSRTNSLEYVDNGDLSRYSPPNSCYLKNDGRDLNCQLLRDSYNRQTMFLNWSITNDEGTLTCFEHRGTTPPDCATRKSYGASPSKAQTLVSPIPMAVLVAVFVAALVFRLR
ncbi:hypothetical protein Hte_003965 [Hypoxylon texense]